MITLDDFLPENPEPRKVERIDPVLRRAYWGIWFSGFMGGLLAGAVAVAAYAGLV